jgi:hypothetical protein
MPLWVKSAVPASPYNVIVEFSHPLDPGYAPHWNPLNYTVASLTIVGAAPGINPNEVRLQTHEQAATVYTLVVGTARTVPGDLLDPARDTVLFAGFPVAPTFFVTAQSRSKVMLLFSTALLLNPAATDPSSYTVTDFNGTSFSVDSVTLNGPAGFPAVWATLELGDDLDPGGYYVCTISSSIQAANGLPFSPRTDVFQYIERDLDQPFNIPISAFSGEVTGGLLGQPLGQIFFSTALDATVPADSTIQVDSVSVCTRAYDVYEIPTIPDPKPLMIWGPTLPYNAAVLNDSNDVLYATAERLGLARVNLADLRTDTWSGAADGPCDATLQETFDQSRVPCSTWTTGCSTMA